MWHGMARSVHMHNADALHELKMLSSLTFQRYSAGNLESMGLSPSDLYELNNLRESSCSGLSNIEQA